MITQSLQPRASVLGSADGSDESPRGRPFRGLGLGMQRTAAALPEALSARAFGTAWLIAIAIHVVLVIAWIGFHASQEAPEKPLIRLVFVEPAPPLAAPLGAPTGAGMAPSATAPTEPVPPKAVEPPKPVPAEAERLRHFDEKAKPKPKVEAKPKPEPRRAAPRAEKKQPAAPAPAADVAPGVAQGAVGGGAMGVVGGVAGGIVGGTVGGTGSGPLRLSEVAQAPTIIHRVEPVYPAVARRREIEGLVVLEAILDREGRLEPDVKVIRSIPLLDDEAVAAVKQWRFRPARSREGSPVRVILEIPIRFVLH